MADSDVDIELSPPSANRVARRALALAAVACRSGIETDAGNPEAEKFREEIVEWLERVGLNDEIEPNEMALLITPLGELTERQTIDASWRGEGLAVPPALCAGRRGLPHDPSQHPRV